MDETHFVINFDNSKILGFCEEISSKYTNVIFSGKDVIILV